MKKVLFIVLLTCVGAISFSQSRPAVKVKDSTAVAKDTAKLSAPKIDSVSIYNVPLLTAADIDELDQAVLAELPVPKKFTNMVLQWLITRINIRAQQFNSAKK